MKSAKQKKYDPKHFEWPKWNIRLFKWLSIISFLLAFILFLMPQINDRDKGKYRIILVIVLLVTPLLIQTFLWIVKILLAISKRTAFYPLLYNLYQNTHSQLLGVEQEFISWMLNSMKPYALEIERVIYQREQLYISLKKKTELDLNKDDIIIVVDGKDLHFMGQFKVTEIRDHVYYAVGIKHIDSLWLGFMRQREEVEMMPNLLAYYKKTGE